MLFSIFSITYIKDNLKSEDVLINMEIFFKKIVMLLAVGLFISDIATGELTGTKEKKEKLKKGLTAQEVNAAGFCDEYPELKSCEMEKNTTFADEAMKEFFTFGCGLQDLLLGMDELKDEGSIQQSRSKRSTAQNPCAASASQKVLIYVDDEFGNEVEVYQNIANHVYRTFFTSDCVDETPPTGMPSGSSYSCLMIQVKVKAAVFHPVTYAVVVRNIMVDATCSIHYTPS